MGPAEAVADDVLVAVLVADALAVAVLMLSTHCCCAASNVVDKLQASGATNDTHVRGGAEANSPHCCDDTGTSSDAKPPPESTMTEATPLVPFTDVDTTNAVPGAHRAADAVATLMAAGGSAASR